MRQKVYLSYTTLCIAALLHLSSCGDTGKKTMPVGTIKTSIFSKPHGSVFINDTIDDFTREEFHSVAFDNESLVIASYAGLHQDVYAVIADTSNNYRMLYKEILTIYKALHIPINLGVQFHKDGKGSIVRPKNTGIYFTRNYISDFMSIEDASIYDTAYEHRKLFCITASIFAQKSSADSLAGIIRPFTPNVFVLKSINHFM